MTNEPATTRESAGEPAPMPTRWWIAGLLFLAAVLNYVDKNTFALLAPTIQADLKFDDATYANIQNAFQIAYTIALLASGVIVDRLGARTSLALFVGWWSLANICTAFARSVFSFGTCRFFLGLGEAGNWTASPKTVSEWFAPKERGLAIGIYTAGTPLGMTLAPIVVIWLASAYGWRSAFVITGVLGLFWLVPWLLIYRMRPRITETAQTSTSPQNSKPAQETATADEMPGWTWLEALSRREVWCLLLARMLSDPIWFFYQNWFPKYLNSARGLTQKEITITWVMFLAAGLGSLVGGWSAGRLMRDNREPVRARLLVMLGCALLMPLSPFVAWAPTVTFSLVLASVIVFAHLAWLTNISALVVDVVPSRSLGVVFGLVAAGSSVGAIGMNALVAKLVKSYSYEPWYVLAAFLHLAAIVLLGWGVARRAPR